MYATELIYQVSSDHHEFTSSDKLQHYDVICGRHRSAFDNVGNRRFRVLVSLSLDSYKNAPTRAHKSAVIKNIVDSVHTGGGRFLQRKGSGWIELDEKQTHDKVGHALRDMSLSTRAKSESPINGPRSLLPTCIRPIERTSTIVETTPEVCSTTHDLINDDSKLSLLDDDFSVVTMDSHDWTMAALQSDDRRRDSVDSLIASLFANERAIF
jgi:hypothetical protein